MVVANSRQQPSRSSRPSSAGPDQAQVSPDWVQESPDWTRTISHRLAPAPSENSPRALNSEAADLARHGLLPGLASTPPPPDQEPREHLQTMPSSRCHPPSAPLPTTPSSAAPPSPPPCADDDPRGYSPSSAPPPAPPRDAPPPREGGSSRRATVSRRLQPKT
jgi:hypothetical protein